MSALMTFLTGFSLTALMGLSIHNFIKTKEWRSFILQVFALILFIVFLNSLFTFPSVLPNATGRGEQGQEAYLVILLYLCMLLGMVSQYAYTHFAQPKAKRKVFDMGLFIAPFFTSPIIFIPLVGAFQTVDIDLTRLTIPKMMVLLVAFENGFFSKAYFDHRRREKEKNAN